MASSLQNYTITAGGVAQQLLPARLGRSLLIIKPLDEDAWIQFGSTAAVNNGEFIYSGSPATFTVEHYPEIGATVSIFSATTASRVTVREV